MELLGTVKEFILNNKIDEAKIILNEMLTKDPEDAFAVFELAKIYQMQGNDVSAEAEYKKVLKINANYHLAKLELARIYFRQRRLEMALEQYRGYLKEFPNDANIYKELANVYTHIGYIDESMKCLERSADIEPNNVDILMELGRVYREQGQKSKAVETFNKIYAFIDNGNRFLSNKVLNEIEATEGKEVLDSKVRSMIAMVLDRCNIKCRICDIWKGTWQVRDSIMKEIVDLFPYMEDISWQGGEVFMMNGFEDILMEGARHDNLKQVIFTNGLLINEKILQKIEKGKTDIVFSIDSVDKETYEYIRSGARFERLIKVLGLVKEFRSYKNNKVNIYLNAVIMKSNHTELENFIEFAKKYDFNAVTFTPIRRNSEEDIFLGDKNKLESLKNSMKNARKIAASYGIRLNDWLPLDSDVKNKADENMGNTLNEQGIKEDKNKPICFAPWQRLLIDCNGMARPFGFCLKKFVGSTDSMSLSEIWNGEGMRFYRRKLANNDYLDLCQKECIMGQVKDKICRVE
ncbi:MAG: radical SAM protein [Elusimicrobia bacterium]|nr:radical SAM protein [Candidatus Liberimonas magnetica]